MQLCILKFSLASRSHRVTVIIKATFSAFKLICSVRHSASVTAHSTKQMNLREDGWMRSFQHQSNVFENLKCYFNCENRCLITNKCYVTKLESLPVALH